MGMDVIGHDWAVRLLERHLVGGKLRHAYLFTGMKGVGKRTLALRFAEAIACVSPAKPGEPCGKCRACTLIRKGTYPDLHLVSAKEVGGTLQVEQVRELQRKLALSPYEGRVRIALLLRFQESSTSAANALLKTLEEPPAHVVLLLTARSAESLLPTIVSRCVRIDLRPVASNRLQTSLEERGVPVEEARLLAAMAGGSPGRALALAETPEALKLNSQRLEEFMALLAMNRGQRFRYASRFDRKSGGFKQLSEARRAAVEVIESWRPLLRGAMLMSLGAAAEEDQMLGDRGAARMAEGVDAESIIRAIRATDVTLEALARNANPRLAMESLMLDLPNLKSR
jgi:DNA polymerase-3 subunit delta'